MLKILILSFCTIFSVSTIAQSNVIEGVVEKADVITTETGRDGKPLLGAAVGVGIGSLFGSGHGNDAAKIAGGIIGAKKSANMKKKMHYGWRYIVKTGEELQVVDAWCPVADQQCAGVAVGKEVYVINGKEIEAK